jgi:hypothetical protein
MQNEKHEETFHSGNAPKTPFNASKEAELVGREELRNGDKITPVHTRLEYIKQEDVYTVRQGKAFRVVPCGTRKDGSTIYTEEELPLHGQVFFRLKKGGFTLE